MNGFLKKRGEEMTVKYKSTPKKLRMATILQSRHNQPCYFCGEDSVAVDTVELDDMFQVRHKCSRHRLFGYWPESAAIWGWND